MMPTLKAQLRWCRRMQIALAIAALVAVSAFALTVYRPREARLRDLRRQLSAANAQLDAKRHEVAEARPSASSGNASNQSNAESFVRELTRAADDAKLIQLRWRPGVPSRANGLCRQPIELSCEGDFLDVFSLLRRAEELPPRARFRSVEINSQDPNSGRVQLQASLDVYSPEE